MYTDIYFILKSASWKECYHFFISCCQFPGPLRYHNEFKLISKEDTGLRGSCPNYHGRKNISEDVRGHSSGDCVNLETAYER